MIGYITLGTNNLERAVNFFDQLLTVIDAKRFMEVEDHFVAWTNSPESPGISVTKPFDGETATVGNGSMVALMVENEEKVKELYAKAIELGGTDEGKPGVRGDEGFYAAYFRDLDGNKLNVFCMNS
ncbi:MAG: VOC family protein [Gammaproteobacteria bacterium]|nr:VOC family protein [Gammaproteobacteria bacterium]